MVSEERRILESTCDELRHSRSLTRAQWDMLKSKMGERFTKAWQLVEQRRIKRYVFKPSGRVVWIVVGRKNEYLILPRSGYCDCNDFYYKVVSGEVGLCYHFLGQRLADALKNYDDVFESDEFYGELMAEWRRGLKEQEED